MPSNNLPDNFKETEIGPIPADWEIAPLGELCTVRGGKRLPKGHSFSEKPTPFPYIRVTDFANWSVDPLNLRYLTPEDREKLERYIITADDVYISIAGTIGRVGTIPEQLNNANLTENAARIIISDKRKLDNRYLVGFLASNRGQGQIDIRMTKTSQPKLALTRIKQIPVPLPPLPEQRRIARVLSTIQRAIAAQDDLIAAAREVKRSLMQRLFTYGPGPEPAPTKETELGEIPEHWEVVRLGEVAEKPQYGYTASASDHPVGPKFLRITDIQDSGVFWSSVPYCEIDERGLLKYRLEAGDLLFARIGATTGKTYLVTECPESVFASYLMRVRVQPQKILPEYAHYFTNTEAYWRQINASKGGRLKQGINIPVLTSLLLSLSPLSEQREIAHILSAVDRKIETEKQRKAALQALFKAMLHQLMTGQLRLPKSER